MKQRTIINHNVRRRLKRKTGAFLCAFFVRLLCAFLCAFINAFILPSVAFCMPSGIIPLPTPSKRLQSKTEAFLCMFHRFAIPDKTQSRKPAIGGHVYGLFRSAFLLRFRIALLLPFPVYPACCAVAFPVFPVLIRCTFPDVFQIMPAYVFPACFPLLPCYLFPPVLSDFPPGFPVAACQTQRQRVTLLYIYFL